MDMLWYGVKVMVVGMVVVFVGLIILIACINALRAVKGKENAAPEAGRAAEQPVFAVPAAAAAPLPETVRAYTPGPPITRSDGAFHAVVNAAIAQTLTDEGVNPEGGFVIRSVKKIDELGKKLTTKDGALYAVVTGAVAETLAAEGVNPDGGFVIHSVKAQK